MKNAVRKEPAKVESTKIGLSNVKSMMQQQGGSLETGLEGEDFKVCLSFPVVE